VVRDPREPVDVRELQGESLEPGRGGRIEVHGLEIRIGRDAGVSERGEPGPGLDQQEISDGGADLGLTPRLARRHEGGEREPGACAETQTPAHLMTPNFPIDVPTPGASTWNT